MSAFSFSPAGWSRRQFLQRSAAWGCALGFARTLPGGAAPGPARTKAAVIGDTGHGNYGHGLDVIFNGRPEIEVVAVADPEAAGRAKAAERCGARRQFADYRELLARERPELVAVAPRWTDQHFAIIKAALEAGAHVYAEKPFTQTLAEADELLALAHRTGRKIAVAHQSRIAPSTLFLKRKLDEGFIGELLEIRMHGKQDQRAGAEDMVVLGVHQFEEARFFAGDPLWCTAVVRQDGHDITRADVRQAHEAIGPLAGNEVEAMFAFPRGVNAFFTSREKNFTTAGAWGMELVGSKGVVRFVNTFMPVLQLRYRRDTSEGRAVDEWLPLEGDPGARATPAEREMTAGNRRVVDDWLAAIAEDREPVCSGRSAMGAIEMVHAVFAAGLSRGRIEFPLKNRQHPLAG